MSLLTLSEMIPRFGIITSLHNLWTHFGWWINTLSLFVKVICVAYVRSELQDVALD